MRIVGVDPNKTKLAIATLDGSDLNLSIFITKATSRSAQLAELAEASADLTKGCSAVYIEEPLVGRNVRSSLHVAMTAGAIGSAVHAPCYFVPNTTWKKSIVGAGNANKTSVASWLNTNYITYAQQCDGDQDLIDATTVALYGRQVQELATSFLNH